MYKIEVYPDAEDQISALSAFALGKLRDAIGAVRQFLFGPGGAGMITYLVLDDQREVHVLKVLWIGD